MPYLIIKNNIYLSAILFKKRLGQPIQFLSKFGIIFCFSILPFAFLSGVAVSKNLYVDGSTGNDSVSYESNSQNTPWRTIGRAAWGNASRSSSNASQAAVAGDTVTVATGTYNTTQYTDDRTDPLYSPVNSGSSGNYITFTTDGGVVTLTSTASEGGGEAIIGSAIGTSYVKWDGFTIRQADINYRRGGGVANIWGNYTTISNCVLIGEYTTYPSDDNHTAIFSQSNTGTIIENNDISGFTGASGRNDTGITVYVLTQATIRHNEIHDNHTGMYIKGSGANGPVDIYLNEIYDNSGDGIALHGASSNGDVYQNIVRDNTNGINFFGDADSSTPYQMEVYNNTFINNSARTVYYKPLCASITSSTFIDNIVYGSSLAQAQECESGVPITTSRVDNDYNFYYGYSSFGYVALGTWQSTYSQDVNSTFGTDPDFTDESSDDYTLRPGSPALTASSTFGPVGAYITGNEQIGRGPSQSSTIPTPSGFSRDQ